MKISNKVPSSFDFTEYLNEARKKMFNFMKQFVY